MQARSAGSGGSSRTARADTGLGWGYHFDVQTRFFAYRAGTPNMIATSFAAHALPRRARAARRAGVGRGGAASLRLPRRVAAARRAAAARTSATSRRAGARPQREPARLRGARANRAAHRPRRRCSSPSRRALACDRSAHSGPTARGPTRRATATAGSTTSTPATCSRRSRRASDVAPSVSDRARARLRLLGARAVPAGRNAEVLRRTPLSRSTRTATPRRSRPGSPSAAWRAGALDVAERLRARCSSSACSTPTGTSASSGAGCGRAGCRSCAGRPRPRSARSRGSSSCRHAAGGEARHEGLDRPRELAARAAVRAGRRGACATAGTRSS